MYWALSTLATVGYGDISAKLKIVGEVKIVVGPSVVARTAMNFDSDKVPKKKTQGITPFPRKS